jgi:hypothetical protein
MSPKCSSVATLTSGSWLSVECKGTWNQKNFLGMKHILTSEGKCKRLNPMIPTNTSILGVALVWESQLFKALIKR